MIMFKDDEKDYTDRDPYDWRDSAPIEYITESEDYYSDEDDSDDPDPDGWADKDYEDD
jgi:hypothetical protein